MIHKPVAPVLPTPPKDALLPVHVAAASTPKPVAPALPAPSKDAPPAQGTAASTATPAAPVSSAKVMELSEREKALRMKEEQLLNLKKEVDEKIAKYTQLLDDIEAKEKEIEEKKQETERKEKEEREKKAKEEKENREREKKAKEEIDKKEEVEKQAKDEETSGNIDVLVKLFEGMPAEEAAARMEKLDEEIAAVILKRMRGRKGGSVLAAMDPNKSAVIVQRIFGSEKNFPAQ
ncbi:MAG: hypothetical protein FWF95_06110 [Syntrophorhabdaceae bacterium]|nr:hypothetical protein [Syntrophorhabdaceae bacterium]